MPNDMNGRELKVGDVVHVAYTVKAMRETEGEINLTLAGVNAKLPELACNSGIVTIVSTARVMSDEEISGRAAARREPARGDRNTGTM